MSFWTVAQTHSQREKTATEHLARIGFETYYPQIKISAVVDRRKVQRVSPLFPAYVFVRVVDSWYPIQSAIGVMRVLPNIGDVGPAKIEDQVVRAIKQQEIRGFVQLPKQLQPGDKVRIVRGSFKDHIAVYDGMSGKDRQRVLLELLGRMVPIDIDPCDLVTLAVAP